MDEESAPRIVGRTVMVPLKTAVLTSHQRLVTGVLCTDAEGIVVEMDVRRAGWRRLLDLPPRTEIHWADVRTVEHQKS